METMKIKKGMTVISPVDGFSQGGQYLTKGKEYEVLDTKEPLLFSFRDDEGDLVKALECGDLHTDWEPWIIKE